MDTPTALSRLKASEAALRSLGFSRLSLFGSVARGEAEPGSDVDLAAEFDESAQVGLFGYAVVVDRLSKLLGTHVDLVCEPAAKPRMQAGIDRDRVVVF